MAHLACRNETLDEAYKPLFTHHFALFPTSPFEKGFSINLILLLIVSLWLSGCQAKSVFLKPSLEEEGEFFIYLEPLPQEADRLTFTLGEVAAVREDGTTFPLSLFFQEIKGSEMKRQRLLASATLPPGHYIGLAFRAAKALLKHDDEEAALQVDPEAVRADFPFDIAKKKAFLVRLEFSVSKSVQDRHVFIPSFSISAPERPVASLAGYVANSASNTITVFDKERKEVVGVIATGAGPRGIVLDQRSRKAYVTLSMDDAVEVIDIAVGGVIDRIRMNTGDAPQEPALSTDGKFLFTANRGSDSVSVIDTVSLVEINRVPVGQRPNSVLVDRAGKRIYAFNAQSNSISVIDVATQSVAATLSTEAEPLRGDFNARGDRLYVIHKGSPYLSVIDPFSLASLERVYVGTGMSAIKEDIKTGLLYIGKAVGGSVDIFDPFSLFLVDSIITARSVAAMAMDGDENTLYLLTPENNTMTVFNLISRKTIAEIDVGEGAYWVALMGER